MQKFLVTGGAGFIGFALVRKLQLLESPILVVDDFSTGRKASIVLNSQTDLIRADIRDDVTIEKIVAGFQPSHVFHLAALHYIPACDADPEKTWAINVEGTYRVAAAAHKAGTKVFVLASTAAVYAPSDGPHGEDDPLGPIDVYGKSKVAAERAVRSLLPANRVEIARIFNVYGPADTNPHLIPEILAQVAAGAESVQLGNVETYRDYVFVEDVAESLLRLALEGEAELSVTNIASGSSRTALDVVTSLSRIVGRELSVGMDPERLRPVDRPYLAAQTNLLMSRTGVRPRDLEEGLRDAWRG